MKTIQTSLIVILVVISFSAPYWAAKKAHKEGFIAGVAYSSKVFYDTYSSDDYYDYGYYSSTPDYLLLPAEKSPKPYNPNGPVF